MKVYNGQAPGLLTTAPAAAIIPTKSWFVRKKFLSGQIEAS